MSKRKEHVYEVAVMVFVRATGKRQAEDRAGVIIDRLYAVADALKPWYGGEEAFDYIDRNSIRVIDAEIAIDKEDEA